MSGEGRHLPSNAVHGISRGKSAAFIAVGGCSHPPRLITTGNQVQFLAPLLF